MLHFLFRYNMKVEQSITLPSEGLGAHRNHYPHQRSQQQQQDFGESPDTQVYGMSLEHLMNQQGRRVLPRPIRECLAFIGHHGLATEGLFRRSPPSTALRSAKDSYNYDQAVDLSLAGVHVAAVLLKLFFRELPEPVFSNHNYSLVRALPASIPLAAATASQDTSSETVEIAKQMDHVRARYVEEVILPSLKPEYRLLLCFTFALLQMVARNEKTNRMTAYNLAIVWAPNLARSSNPVLDVTMCVAGPAAPTVGSVVQIMVQMYDKVFRREIGLILGGQAGQVVDPAMEVIRIVDRMNTGEIIGLKSPSPALPPKAKSPALPPRVNSPALPPRVKSPALPPRVKSPINELAPDLPPRILSPGLSPSAKSPSADSVESVQVFADAESASLPPLSANMEVSGSEEVSVEPALAEEPVESVEEEGKDEGPVESVESVEKNEAVKVGDAVMPEAVADKPIDVKSDEPGVKPIDIALQLPNSPETTSDQRVDASGSVSGSAAVESK
ncbi:hypothetical protein LPJ66_008426 [Kickxella alabastrina]|uniref:Uncharacterized protein n=1 Tax=Kickxella alabastrina TaxID=61397 RepID=A0ACC1I636_9FUNG|nr:hypothetical protein LPJ66_008426 [Kickxella alabastrina]